MHARNGPAAYFERLARPPAIGGLPNAIRDAANDSRSAPERTSAAASRAPRIPRQRGPRRLTRRLAACILLAFAGAVLAQSGGGWSMPAYRIAGGGGLSTGGGYALHATIAQHEAAEPLQAGEYLLQPGFWGVGAGVPPTDSIFSNGYE